VIAMDKYCGAETIRIAVDKYCSAQTVGIAFDNYCGVQTIVIAVGKYCGAQTDGITIDEWKQLPIRHAIRHALQRANCWDSRRPVLRHANRRDGRRGAEAMRSNALFNEHCGVQTVGIAVGKYCSMQTDGIAIDERKR